MRAQYGIQASLKVNQTPWRPYSAVLGVVFQCDFRMNKHVDFILSQCSQRFYLLKLLRNMGLGPGQLNIVAHSIIVSRIRYALPAWSGYLSVELTSRFNSLLKKLQRYGFIHNAICFEDLAYADSLALFTKIKSDCHCLHHLLPRIKSYTNLRQRGHDFVLPTCNNTLCKNSFVIRSLY